MGQRLQIAPRNLEPPQRSYLAKRDAGMTKWKSDRLWSTGAAITYRGLLPRSSCPGRRGLPSTMDVPALRRFRVG